MASAIDMMALPFHDEGNLHDYTNDIDFGYGTSPDVVYKYTPDHDGCFTVDGCASQYDQMIFVVDETQTTIVAFNDDGAACGNASSQIAWLPVYAGVLYYYILDGYGGSAGPFVLDVFWRECDGCAEYCPPGAIVEGEGCADPYVDNYNGGCNSTPPAFSVVNAVREGTIVIFGSIFNYYTGSIGRRDTDWYLLADLPAIQSRTGVPLDIACTSCFGGSSGSLYFIHILPPCAADIPAGIHMDRQDMGVLDYVCDTSDGSNWVVFQSKNYYDPTWYPCTEPESWFYILTIDNYVDPTITPAEGTSWGEVKQLFK